MYRHMNVYLYFMRK